MNRFHRIALGALVLGACAPKGEASSEDIASDSTAAVFPPDSTVAVTELTVQAPAIVESASKASVAPKGTSKSAKQSGVVGRDSAFGPTFIVDSTGKMVPIPTKKP